MINFSNTVDPSEGIKIDEIFNLFRTDSLDFNDKLSSILQNYPTTKHLISNYLKIDIQNIFNIFNKILKSSTEKIDEENTNANSSEIEMYIYRITKIILLFHLIQKCNQLLLTTIKNTKKYIENLSSKTDKNLFLKDKIDSFMNDLTNSSNYINDLIASCKIICKRSYSRRSTNDITNSSISMMNKSQEKELNAKEIKVQNNLIRSSTPKFKDSESTERRNSIKEDASSKSPIKIDSSLTLQKLNFVQLEDKEDKNSIRNVKKYNSHKIKNKSYDPYSTTNVRNSHKSQSIHVKESLFNTKRKISVNSESEINNNQNERIKILAEFFDMINLLYKENKINISQKINIKQKVISSPKKIIDKFNKNYNYMNKITDKTSLNNYIKAFLLKEFDIL
jgi:hypothetical protein